MAKSIANSGAQGADQLRQIIANIQTAIIDTALTTGGLATAATNTKVKTATAVYSVINGAPILKAATDNLFTLSGSVTNAKFNVYVFTLNAAGTAAAYMGTEASTLAGV